MATLITALILAGITGVIIRRMVKKKQKGEHLCGGSCLSCKSYGLCHMEEKQEKS